MEAPQVFLAALLLVLVLKLDDPAFVFLAWGFVTARVIHSVVHLSFNKVLPRFTVFLVATACLFGIVGKLALAILTS